MAGNYGASYEPSGGSGSYGASYEPSGGSGSYGASLSSSGGGSGGSGMHAELELEAG